MRRLLTGIQSSGRPHLGNILGAILPAIELAKETMDSPFYFIADMHSQTTINDADVRRENTRSVAASWLALGCDPAHTVLYRQSQIPQVCELSWYLANFTPTSLLLRAHAYADKVNAGKAPKAGLLFYPTLMAADILLYNASHVPVGRDQQEHLDITRDVAGSMNHTYGQEIFLLPEPIITAHVMVPGIDGGKMSKSRNNIIDLFASEKELKKSINKIVTDSAGANDTKDPDQCTVFGLFKLVAPLPSIQEMSHEYKTGKIGYGSAKKKLLDLLLTKFEEERDLYQELQANPNQLEDILTAGEDKARRIAEEKIRVVRDIVGFNAERSRSASELKGELLGV